MTKAQFVAEIASKTGLTQAQVAKLFESVAELVKAELKHGRPVTIPGMVKVTVVHKKATPARPGRNPFTGAVIQIKAKPARKVVKVRAVKVLKDMVA